MSNLYPTSGASRGPRHLKDKHKYNVYDNLGNLIGQPTNRTHAAAAKKLVSKKYTRIVVEDPNTGEWRAYIGKRVKLQPKKLTQHNLMFNRMYTPKVFAHPVEEVAHPDFLAQILASGEPLEEQEWQEPQEYYQPHGWQHRRY